MRYLLILLALALVLVGCQRNTLRGENDVTLGNDLFTLAFNDPASFETGDFPASNASLSIEAGKYIVRQAGDRTAYIWGQGGEPAQNVSVEAQAQPSSSFKNDLYGVMCRVTEDGAGYAFVVSSDGFGAIARTDGKSLSFIFDWTENAAIKKGQAANTVRAICVDNYLALYVNGKLVGDAEDTRYPEAGQVGLLAGIFIEKADESGEVAVEFDALTVKHAELK